MTYLCVGGGIIAIVLVVLLVLGLCRAAADMDDRMGIR